MKNRWLLGSLLVVGTFAVLGLIVSIRQGDDQPPGHAKRQLSMREWSRSKEVSASEYTQTFAMFFRSPSLGTVLLPKEPAETETVAAKHPREVGIVPPQVCGRCHAEHWNECQQTAHFRASSEPTRDGIRGSFEPPRNRVRAFHPKAWLEVVAKPDGFYQQFHINYQGQPFRHEARMDRRRREETRTYLFD